MDFTARDLRLYADDREIGKGCRMMLTARQDLTLRPALHHLEIIDLSDSSATMLTGAKFLEVRSGLSVLAFGEPIEVLTKTTQGKRITSAVFSPGLSLWRSSVSLSLPGGMTVTDTLRKLLAAASGIQDSGSNAGFSSDISLAAFTAENRVLSRPQAFFGRTCDALTLLAETVNADAFLSSAGLCVTGREAASPAFSMPESDLLSAPLMTGSHLIISVRMLTLNPGSWIRTEWKGVPYCGRIISSLIQADNHSGPWKSELELETDL